MLSMLQLEFETKVTNKLGIGISHYYSSKYCI